MKKIVTFLMLISSLQSFASWTQTGPEGGSFFIKENNGILYSTNAIGFYNSTDNGLNWNRVSALAGFTMKDLVFAPSRLLAACNTGIQYSFDNGVSWISSNNGFQNADTTNGVGTVSIIRIISGRIITSVSSGTYYSDNEGQNWILSTGGVAFNSLCQSSSTIFGIGSNNIYLSNDDGQSWSVSSTNGINASDLNIMKKITFSNGKLILGCNSISVYVSSDNGLNWSLVTSGMTGTNIGTHSFYNNTICLQQAILV